MNVVARTIAMMGWVLATPTFAADGQPIVTLRDSGYLLGDLLDESIALSLPAGTSIDADSLPLPGRVAPWMEVRRARIERGTDASIVIVTFQIFAEVEQTSRVPIPAFKLRIRDAKQSQLVVVPEQSFLLSPSLPPTLTDQDRELKASPPPRLLPQSENALEFFAALLATIACTVYLLWIYDRLPFFPRSPGPFARLWRRWRRRGMRDSDSADLLRDWHVALNQAAGETVYVSTLPRLFERAPHLMPMRESIERLFATSWQHFYGSNAAPQSTDVLDLIRDSAARERGVPC